MKKAVNYIALILLSFCYAISYSQTCTSTATLSSPNGNCLGSAILNITASSSISKIDWYNGTTLVKTVSAHNAGVTVAGGNGSGSGLHQLNYPEGVFVDESENVYVCEHSNNRVVKWAPGATSGVVVAGGNGPGSDLNQLNAPIGIYVDLNGDIYICDTNNQRIQKWLPGATEGQTVAGNGVIGSRDDQFSYPYDIFLDKNKSMYIVDHLNHRVQKWLPGASKGITVAGGNGAGSASNQLNEPTGIFVDGNGNIYVADYKNDRIQRWAPGATSGITVAGGNGPGSDASHLDHPYDVFVDAGENIFITDYKNYRVQKWSPGALSGETVAGGNGFGSNDNQIYFAVGLHVDNNQNIYVTDEINSRVQKWGKALAIDTKFTPAIAGNYYAVVTDNSGCSATTNTIVVGSGLTPAVSILIISGSQNSCQGTPVTFAATPTNGGTAPSYQWKLNGNTTGTNSSSYTSSTLSDGDVVSCEMTSNLTCVTIAKAISSNLAMTVNPIPTVSLGNEIMIDKGGSVQLNAYITGNIISYQWSPATGLNNSMVQNPVASPLVTTTYKLNVISATNCTSNAEITIVVSANIKVPNVFSPNGDGINDSWEIANLQYYPGCSVSIYNRYGQAVFHSIGYGNPWDGKFNGKPLPFDSYYYIIDLKKGEKPMAGNITILR